MYSNAIFSQNPRKVAVGGNTYIVSNYMVNNVTNKLSVSNFINKERFTASPNQEVAIAARNVFSKNRINALKKTKDAILGSSDISSDKFSIEQKKTAEHFVYLNNHKQIYNNEQQFSISCMGALQP